LGRADTVPALRAPAIIMTRASSLRETQCRCSAHFVGD
jgi:hypothetical protein